MKEKGVHVRFNIIDSSGFAEGETEPWTSVVQLLNRQHRSYQLKMYAANDNRIHACLYFIPPTTTMTHMDIQAMTALHSRVNLIPVIGKADSVTPLDISTLKNRLSEFIKDQKLNVYNPTSFESKDKDGALLNQLIANVMPFSVIGSETDVLVNGKKVRGRAYRWGIAEVENEEHCDLSNCGACFYGTYVSCKRFVFTFSKLRLGL